MTPEDLVERITHYAGDKKAGDTSGQGLDQFGAKWYVLDPAGNKIDDD